ncbi:unnamed protein product [Vitrella brassicaformis CCMP3155]|uniref:Uncharacterized protein n=1 Tax=Vitrella brassicaformis (strain CCMP3155) TaxID=1169540 RepID=A0A0G4F5Y8_VITBC|nr:unnamed protein product [Vitrella brassicaformis CCMP3155]|eukprot:CEM07786.1 unnamed protein product [Vitrella brassicaformis CCMP3155]
MADRKKQAMPWSEWEGRLKKMHDSNSSSDIASLKGIAANDRVTWEVGCIQRCPDWQFRTSGHFFRRGQEGVCGCGYGQAAAIEAFKAKLKAGRVEFGSTVTFGFAPVDLSSCPHRTGATVVSRPSLHQYKTIIALTALVGGRLVEREVPPRTKGDPQAAQKYKLPEQARELYDAMLRCPCHGHPLLEQAQRPGWWQKEWDDRNGMANLCECTSHLEALSLVRREGLLVQGGATWKALHSRESGWSPSAIAPPRPLAIAPPRPLAPHRPTPTSPARPPATPQAAARPPPQPPAAASAASGNGNIDVLTLQLAQKMQQLMQQRNLDPHQIDEVLSIGLHTLGTNAPPAPARPPTQQPKPHPALPKRLLPDTDSSPLIGKWTAKALAISDGAKGVPVTDWVQRKLKGPARQDGGPAPPSLTQLSSSGKLVEFLLKSDQLADYLLFAKLPQLQIRHLKGTSQRRGGIQLHPQPGLPPKEEDGGPFDMDQRAGWVPAVPITCTQCPDPFEYLCDDLFIVFPPDGTKCPWCNIAVLAFKDMSKQVPRVVIHFDGTFKIVGVLLYCSTCKMSRESTHPRLISTYPSSFLRQLPCDLHRSMLFSRELSDYIMRQGGNNSASFARVTEYIRQSQIRARMSLIDQYNSHIHQYRAHLALSLPAQDVPKVEDFMPMPTDVSTPVDSTIISHYVAVGLQRESMMNALMLRLKGRILSQDWKHIKQMRNATQKCRLFTVCNEIGFVIAWTVTVGEGQGEIRHLLGSLRDYFVKEGVKPPIAVYKDTDCCRQTGISVWQEMWPQILELLDIFHKAQRLAKALHHGHQLEGAFWRDWGDITWQLNSEDIDLLIKAVIQDANYPDITTVSAAWTWLKTQARHLLNKHVRRGTFDRFTYAWNLLTLYEKYQPYSLFNDKAPHVFYLIMRHVMNGCLEDPPDGGLFYQTGSVHYGTAKIELPIYSTARGTNKNESVNSFVSAAIHGSVMGAPLMQVKLTQAFFEHNMSKSKKLGFGHLPLADPSMCLDFVDRASSMRLAGNGDRPNLEEMHKFVAKFSPVDVNEGQNVVFGFREADFRRRQQAQQTADSGQGVDEINLQADGVFEFDVSAQEEAPTAALEAFDCSGDRAISTRLNHVVTAPLLLQQPSSLTKAPTQSPQSLGKLMENHKALAADGMWDDDHLQKVVDSSESYLSYCNRSIQQLREKAIQAKNGAAKNKANKQSAAASSDGRKSLENMNATGPSHYPEVMRQILLQLARKHGGWRGEKGKMVFDEFQVIYAQVKAVNPDAPLRQASLFHITDFFKNLRTYWNSCDLAAPHTAAEEVPRGSNKGPSRKHCAPYAAHLRQYPHTSRNVQPATFSPHESLISPSPLR